MRTFKSPLTAALLAAAISTLTYPLFAETTGPAGSGSPQTTIQPSLGLNYIIRSSVADQQNFQKIGEISLFAGNFAPAGWKFANGETLSIAQNFNLFNMIGTAFGGDGDLTFKLPDLRGRTAIGAGQGPGLPNYTIGQTIGSEAVSLTVDNLPAHSHTSPLGTTTSTGNGQPFNNMQPSLAVNAFIANSGIFPSESSSVQSATSPFYGKVQLSARDATPDGFLRANGALLDISQNETLFQLIGTNFGGDGQDNYAVPDLRGRAPVHAGQGPGLSNYTLGQLTGTPTQFLSTAQIPAHTHTLPPSPDITDPTGGSQPHSTLQPTLALNYIIAISGLFPDDGLVPLSDSEPMLGQIFLFAANFAPKGFAFCNGQILPINQNQGLFSILGSTYGGNGQTTFALPDLRGRIPVGVGQGDGLSEWLLGEKRGLEAYALSLDSLPEHTHDYNTVAPPIPEPATLTLLSLALTPALLRRRKTAA